MAGAGKNSAFEPRPGVVVVGAGKGGVGTSVLSTMLAIGAAQRGENVLLVDADEAVGSLHMMLGITDPGPGLGSLRAGRGEPEALLVPVDSGLTLFPGGGGGVDATLIAASAERRILLARVAALYERFSTVIVDGGSRLDSVMAACGAGAERLLCVTAPDRIALAASYALFKVARARFDTLPVELIVNSADERKGRGLHAVVRAATQSFLGTDVLFGGTIPIDERLESCLEAGESLAQLDAAFGAAAAAGSIAHRLLAERQAGEAASRGVITLLS